MKEKKRNDLLRLQTIIEKDRLTVNSDFANLLSEDLKDIFTDYMDFDGNVNVTIERVGADFKVQATVVAKRLKAFYPIKNDNVL
jgi:septum formation topological specificity factor MinE